MPHLKTQLVNNGKQQISKEKRKKLTQKSASQTKTSKTFSELNILPLLGYVVGTNHSTSFFQFVLFIENIIHWKY